MVYANLSECPVSLRLYCVHSSVDACTVLAVEMNCASSIGNSEAGLNTSCLRDIGNDILWPGVERKDVCLELIEPLYFNFAVSAD